MAVLEKERTEAQPEVAAPVVGKRRVGWVVWAIAVLAIVAVAAVGLVIWLGDGDAADTGAVDVPQAAAVVSADQSIYTDQELVMMRLANQGYLPRQAVDWERMELKRLVSLGLVPAAALEPAAAPIAGTGSLYTADERTLLDLANRGLIPRESVDWETIELKRLINLGLIPREAAP